LTQEAITDEVSEDWIRKGAVMNIVNTFLSFDKLIGTILVKIIYYVGLVGIALACLFAMFSGFQFGFVQGLGMLVLAPILGFIYLLFWRFVSELWMIMFRISNDLADVKKALAGGASATPPV
jgi:hypothetical protein